MVTSWLISPMTWLYADTKLLMASVICVVSTPTVTVAGVSGEEPARFNVTPAMAPVIALLVLL